LQNVQSLSQLGQYYTFLFTNTLAAEPQKSSFLSRVRDFFAEFQQKVTEGSNVFGSSLALE
jgi:hypothetical protein